MAASTTGLEPFPSTAKARRAACLLQAGSHACAWAALLPWLHSCTRALAWNCSSDICNPHEEARPSSLGSSTSLQLRIRQHDLARRQGIERYGHKVRKQVFVHVKDVAENLQGLDFSMVTPTHEIVYPVKRRARFFSASPSSLLCALVSPFRYSVLQTDENLHPSAGICLWKCASTLWSSICGSTYIIGHATSLTPYGNTTEPTI